jgi:electron transfer flavoprotein-quinone oxidoreductase
MVPEGGYTMIPEVVGDGVLVAGDAAMLVINLGYMVRGMDFAVASGQMAAQAAIEALDKGDTSKAGLASYKTRLENSFVFQDLKQFARFPHFMESTTRMFKGYPEMIGNIMDSMFVVDGSPVQPLKKKIMPELKKIGYGNLLKDALGGMKAL